MKTKTLVVLLTASSAFLQDSRSASRPSIDAALVTEAKKLVEQGDLLVKENKTDDAVAQYKKAVDTFESARDAVSAAELFAKIGDAYQIAHRIPEAVDGFTENLRRLRASLDNMNDVRTAYALGSLGACWEEVADYGRALPMHEQDLSVIRALHQGDHADVAARLNSVATCLENLGRSAEALPKYEETLAMRKRLYTGDHADVATSLNNLGLCLDSLGRSSEALPIHEEALAIRKRVFKGDHQHVATSLNNFASCLNSLGRDADALLVHEESLAMRRRIYKGDHFQVATALNNISFCLNSLGRGAEALPLLEEVLAMRRRIHKGDHRMVAASLNNVATCYNSLGRSADALQMHEEALAMKRRIYKGDHPDVAFSLNNVANCRDALGRRADALQMHEEALAMRKRVFKGDHVEVATSLNNVASNLNALGRRVEALSMYQESLAMRKRIYRGDHPEVARSMNNMAYCLNELGRSAEALPMYEAALAMRTRVYQRDHSEIVGNLNNIASCLAALGRMESALPFYEQALSMARRVGSTDAHLCAANLGRLLSHDLGRPREAIPILEESITQIEDLRSRTTGLSEQDRAAYFRELSRFEAYDGMVAAQLQLSNISEALRYNERRCARSMLDLLYRSAGDPLGDARKQAEESGDQEKAGRILDIEKAVKSTESEVARLSREATVVRGRTDLTEVQKAKEIEPLHRRLADARAKQQEALRNRAQAIKENVQLGEPSDPAEIQATLKDGERMLVYSLNDRNSYLFVVPPATEQIQFYPLRWQDGAAVTVDDLTGCVGAYVDSLASLSGNTRSAPESRPFTSTRHTVPAKATERGRDLFRALMPETVWSEIAKCSRVYIVPHGALHRLPFETLITKTGDKLADSRYWIDDGPPIAYEPSGSVLKLCRERRDQQKRSSPAFDVAALGDAIFSRASVSSPPTAIDSLQIENLRGDREQVYGPLRVLPGTKTEVEAIEAAVLQNNTVGRERNVKILLGENATKAKLLHAAPQARFLHIATHHSPYETDAASYSALALTVPKEDTPGDDGFLKLLDLLEHWRGKLVNCELTVLSACSTQRGQLTKDEGMYAMPIGFLYAGCPSVIASLWPVEDQSTADLMSRFYGKLMKQQTASLESKLSAFTAARKELRRLYPEPFYWAPFIYIGDPR